MVEEPWALGYSEMEPPAAVPWARCGKGAEKSPVKGHWLHVKCSRMTASWAGQGEGIAGRERAQTWTSCEGQVVGELCVRVQEPVRGWVEIDHVQMDQDIWLTCL
jgi:hypothetical protein